MTLLPTIAELEAILDKSKGEGGKHMTQLGGSAEIKARREKYWEELSDSEKIERMRGEVKRLVRSVGCLMQASNKMRGHRHADGEIVIPLGFSTGGELDGRSLDEKYF